MTAPRLSEETGQMLGDKFQILRSIGVGTSSRVYLGFDTSLRRHVAIKLLHESLAHDRAFLEQFSADAKFSSKLVNENIVSVFHLGKGTVDESDGPEVPYIVSEFMPGGSLQTLLASGSTLGLAQILSIGQQTANGLEFAHARGFIHRDLRPANLLFGKDRRVQIKDFALARALAESSLTEPDALGPTANLYSAPELSLGGTVDATCDVYSLALVLAECVTGKVPLTGSTTAETIEIRFEQDLDLGAGFGPLREIIEAAGSTDPSERPDAATFQQELLNAASELPTPAPLPIVLTLGEHSETNEMPLPALGSQDPSIRKSARPAVISTVEPASDREPEFAQEVDPAEQESILAASRPQSLGRVEPFGETSTPEKRKTTKTVKERTETGDGSGRARHTSVRTRVLALVVLVLLIIGGGTSYWWSAVRVPQHTVPAVTGQDLQGASKSLRDLRFEVDASGRERVDDTEAGDVLSQSPSPGTKLHEGETVQLRISLGPTLRSFPNLAGMTRDDAVTTIDASDLVLGNESPVNDEAVPIGQVISAAVTSGGSTIDENGQVPKATSIDIVVSAGPAPRIVPSGLIGASAEQARAALQDVQLEPVILAEHDEKAPRGQIIRSSAQSGEPLERGTKVTLIMSDGPAPIAVPDVRGQTGTAGAAALESAGFVVEGIEGSPSGAVLQTDPTPGEKRQRGSAVRIFTKSR